MRRIVWSPQEWDTNHLLRRGMMRANSGTGPTNGIGWRGTRWGLRWQQIQRLSDSNHGEGVNVVYARNSPSVRIEFKKQTVSGQTDH